MASVFLAGCAFVSPYDITFTTPEDAVIEPLSNTLDLAVNDEVITYISAVKCEGQNALEFLPVLKEDMTPKKAHNLSLKLLEDQKDGAYCKVTVTAFDRSTTSTASDSISVYVRSKTMKNEENKEDTEDAEILTEDLQDQTENIDGDEATITEESDAVDVESTLEETNSTKDVLETNEKTTAEEVVSTDETVIEVVPTEETSSTENTTQNNG